MSWLAFSGELSDASTVRESRDSCYFSYVFAQLGFLNEMSKIAAMTASRADFLDSLGQHEEAERIRCKKYTAQQIVCSKSAYHNLVDPTQESRKESGCGALAKAWPNRRGTPLRGAL